MERSSWGLSPGGRTRECSPKLVVATTGHTAIHAMRARTQKPTNQRSHLSVENRPEYHIRGWKLAKCSFRRRCDRLTRKITMHAKCSIYLPCSSIFFSWQRYEWRRCSVGNCGRYSVNECAACGQRGENIWRHPSCGRILRAAHVSTPLHAQMNPFGWTDAGLA